MAQERPSTSVDPAAPRIVKVGGSLLPGREGYARVAAELAKVLDEGPCWIVVSAAKGVTDALQSASGLPEDEGILRLHERLFAGPLPAHLMGWWRTACAAAAAGRTEALMAWGEQASAELLRIRLSDLGHDLPVVELAPERAPPGISRAIVPGFYLRGPDGDIRLLPRGGSDISAVLAAKWAGAQEVSLWKEGGGIRLQPGVTVDRVDAATLLAWLGDRVRPVHPEAVRLAASAGIALALEDPWGQDGATLIVPTAGPFPSRSVPERVAGEAAP